MSREPGRGLSGAIESSVSFSFTPRDAARVGFVYYFLRGSSTHSGPVEFNAAVFRPGSLDTNADFYHLSLFKTLSA